MPVMYCNYLYSYVTVSVVIKSTFNVTDIKKIDQIKLLRNLSCKFIGEEKDTCNVNKMGAYMCVQTLAA